MNKTRNNSKQREEVLKVLRASKAHPSAREIHEQVKPKIPGIALGTVYRNIKVCREDGTVASVGVVNNEERFDGVIEPHPHAVCTRCSKIIDVQKLPIAAAMRLGSFVVDARRTIFYGICADCQRKTNNRLVHLLRSRLDNNN